jgi:hypothetical protein
MLRYPWDENHIEPHKKENNPIKYETVWQEWNPARQVGAGPTAASHALRQSAGLL